MIVSGRMVPASRPAATVKGLTVEPGSKTSVTARLRNLAPTRSAVLFGL